MLNKCIDQHTISDIRATKHERAQRQAVGCPVSNVCEETVGSFAVWYWVEVVVAVACGAFADIDVLTLRELCPYKGATKSRLSSHVVACLW